MQRNSNNNNDNYLDVKYNKNSKHYDFFKYYQKKN